jgi:hypothetical protein
VAQSTTRFGMRIVCPWCAKQLDREWVRRELKDNLKVLAIIVGLVVFLLVHKFVS